LGDHGAAGILRSLVVGNPESPARPAAVLLLAGVYARGGNASQAAFLYRDLAGAEGARGTEARFGLAEALFSLERWAEAAAALRAFLARDASDARAARARFLLGESLLRQGLGPEAAEAFGAVLAAGPGVPEREVSLFRAGALALAAGADRRAADTLGALAGEFPGSSLLAESCWMRGAALSRLGDEAAAVAAWEETRRAGPGTCWEGLALLGIGRALAGQGRHAEAAVALADAERVLDTEGRPEAR
jgi:TolA-binding protein